MPPQIEPEVSRHKCLIYEGHPSETLPIIVPLLREGLKANRRCLYLGDPDMLKMIDTALRSADVDVARELQRGALVLSSDRGHLDKGFDPQAMVDMLTGLIDQAVKDGFAGLCATGDMAWELGEEKNFDLLLDYEARLERVFKDKPLNGICQYRRDAVPERSIRDALITHRAVQLGQALNTDNLFYVPPELLLDKPGVELKDKLADWMWRQLTRIMAAEQQRDNALKAVQRSEAEQRALAGQLAEANQDLERRVRERTSALEGVNRELEAFSYSVSHDLRAPLRAIQGFSRSIMERHEKKLDPEAKEDFERVCDAAKKMARQIDAYLSLASLSSCEVRRETVDLSGEAQEVLSGLQAAEPQRKVEVKVEPGLAATGDPDLLAGVLANLLGNAWKYSAKTQGARIEFGAKKGEKVPTFYVKDNGAGFDMAKKGKLFHPFERLHSESEFQGNGIGLATVQRIIQRHGGNIWAESKPNEGATFYFTLPD